jgi:hypothetical protein
MLNLGLDVGSAALGAAGTVFNIGQQKKAQRHAEKMVDKQFKNQQLLNQQGYDLGVKMFNATGYEAQKEQLKKAGMNPSLLYGSGGSGGSTSTPSAGSAGTGQVIPPYYMDMAQVSKMGAEIDLLKAQANKTREEATNIAEGERDKLSSEIESLNQGITNAKAQNELTKVQTSLLAIENSFKNKTFDMSVEQLDNEVKKLASEARSALINADLDEQTLANKVSIVGRELTNMILQGNALKSGVELNDATMFKFAEELEQKWLALDLEKSKIDIAEFKNKIDKFEAEVKRQYPSMMQIPGKAFTLIEDVIIDLVNMLGGNENTKTVK